MGDNIQVDFANLNYSFIKFQDQYKTLCQEVSTTKPTHIIQAIKKTKGFIYEYLSYIDNYTLQESITDLLDKLTDKLNNDKEYSYLKNKSDKMLKDRIAYNKKYYYYIIKLFNIIGLYGDELSNTFMPNKSDRQKLFKYRNNNSFFEQFTSYKGNTTKELTEFKIITFKQSLNYFIGFYFAYYLFIDEKSRSLCNKTFSNILNILLHNDIVVLITQDISKMSQSNKQILKTNDKIIFDSLMNILYRINFSYSSYGVMPKMNRLTHLDRTTI